MPTKYYHYLSPDNYQGGKNMLTLGIIPYRYILESCIHYESVYMCHCTQTTMDPEDVR